MQLTHFAKRYPDQLSGGQRQRVSARVRSPAARVLLDEPFGALDAKVRQDLRQWLDELHRELGVTSLLVTHDQEEALELANQIVVMHEGLVQQVGSPSEIYDDPKTPFVAGFVGSANVLHGVVEGGHVHLGAFRVPAAEHLEEGAAATAFVRPHTTCGSRRRVRTAMAPTARRSRSVASSASRRSAGSRGSRSASTATEITPWSPVPQSDLAGASEGDLVSVGLLNPKTFDHGEVAAGE